MSRVLIARVVGRLLRPQRVADAHFDLPRAQARAPLRNDRAHAVQVNRDDRDVATLREIGGPATELLAPTIGTASALGEDDEVPAGFDEARRDVGALAVDATAFDRDGAEKERGDSGFPWSVKEVVGCRGDGRPLAESLGERAHDDRGIEVAGVVGGEDHRALERCEMFGAEDLRRREQVGERVADEVECAAAKGPCRGAT